MTEAVLPSNNGYEFTAAEHAKVAELVDILCRVQSSDNAEVAPDPAAYDRLHQFAFYLGHPAAKEFFARYR